MRFFRLAAALAALALAAALGLSLSGSAAAADGHSRPAAAAPQAVQGSVSASDELSPQAKSDCPSTYFCFWQDAGYPGTPGKFSGNNTNWGAYSHSGCANGTWSDCASSGYNHGTSGLGVEVWSGTSYTGLSACLPKDWSHNDFSQLVWPDTDTSFNDSISSNFWTSNC
ncbi:peptidase inhibitor family I36 [Streptomyces sp. Ag109_O5-1]|uniref:peptidase inhibitor family I36 protein n=1 Tax=Streptomyces sp. Ag109_O5-1 TaxID=1938851 RepID=UPI000FA5CB84|nr:peptidase inhibitor family I36 protein [Streptomyces sp. Ag109_O5-1]RPE43741.1 peptidase inhibitor family I36 [Streptomyces sp. Ag109_O5-1]